MRIIGGTFKGRRFQAPKQIPARPTTDYARESLFNVLGTRIDWHETSFLDLFAGIGTITFEAISRGAKDVTSVDKHFAATKWIQSVAATLGVGNLQVITRDASQFLNSLPSAHQFNLIFADPPFDFNGYEALIELCIKHSTVNRALFILEHRKDKSFKEHPNFAEERTYGEVRFTFFNPK